MFSRTEGEVGAEVPEEEPLLIVAQAESMGMVHLLLITTVDTTIATVDVMVLAVLVVLVVTTDTMTAVTAVLVVVVTKETTHEARTMQDTTIAITQKETPSHVVIEMMTDIVDVRRKSSLSFS